MRPPERYLVFLIPRAVLLVGDFISHFSPSIFISGVLVLLDLFGGMKVTSRPFADKKSAVIFSCTLIKAPFGMEISPNLRLLFITHLII